MTTTKKESIKNVLGQLPMAAELYWLVRQRGKPITSRFSLKQLQEILPALREEVIGIRKATWPGKKIFIFATLHYWIEHAALLGMALSAQGHKVALGFLPYGEWQTPVNPFDLKRQNVYAKAVLKEGEPLIRSFSFLKNSASRTILPEAVLKAVDQVTLFDAQYTLQMEEVDEKGDVYRLRKERNFQAAQSSYDWLKANRPDVVIVPNGTIQELGVVYRVSRLLGIPAVTYEFGDQRERIWLAQNAEVMRQETDDLWAARRDIPLEPKELERVKALFTARQKGQVWENFARRWQDKPSEGGEKARGELNLDGRPIVLLATNVLGDSLTLGRNIFTNTMADWISRTVQYFSGRKDVQLIIRVHPGEVLTHGASMVDVVHSMLPKLPEHIHLVQASDKLNTYDLIELADLGLVYTTTVGMEIAMSGAPVIVSGSTHYRGRGFTFDPDSWVSYFKMLGKILDKPSEYRLSREQVDLAWRYAYRFFFEFPKPFPWHLVHVWDDYKKRPLSQVLSPEGLEVYGKTFEYLAGAPMDWFINATPPGNNAEVE